MSETNNPHTAPESKLLQARYHLVSYTQPAEEMRTLGIETPMDLVGYCARVSNPKNQLNTDTAHKLIRFLINRAEWSPLEMVDVTFGITTARDISRQILRHRSATFQEFSQRYAEVDGARTCFREARYEHPTNRQSSVRCDNVEDIEWWINAQQSVINLTQAVYQEARRRHFAKEVARVVLPEGLTLSDLFMKAPIRTWIHYLALRSGNGTQLEHQDIAHGLAQAITKVFPVEEISS